MPRTTQHSDGRETVISRWYAQIAADTGRRGVPRGTIGAALVVLERLKSTFDLDLRSHRADGTGQLIGVSGTAVAKVLSEFGEVRPFLNEGGRTNRGAPAAVELLLRLLGSENLQALSRPRRAALLSSYQAFLVEKVKEYHGRQRIAFVYDTSISTFSHVQRILHSANEVDKISAVAQYLVGAKLQLRFDDQTIENFSSSTADNQLGRAGDFHVGDAVFHVTISPAMGVYNKCERNIELGKRPFLLVPDGLVFGTKASAEAICPGRITVISLESFISQNVEELGVFDRACAAAELRKLLEIYNQRVDSIENDKSLLIDIPDNLP